MKPLTLTDIEYITVLYPPSMKKFEPVLDTGVHTSTQQTVMCLKYFLSLKKMSIYSRPWNTFVLLPGEGRKRRLNKIEWIFCAKRIRISYKKKKNNNNPITQTIEIKWILIVIIC